jgi:hypothetical protein
MDDRKAVTSERETASFSRLVAALAIAQMVPMAKSSWLSVLMERGHRDCETR